MFFFCVGHKAMPSAMDASQIATLSLFLTLGPLVLASYGLLYKGAAAGRDFWFGMPRQVQYVYYVFMLLAAVGLCTFTGAYCARPRPTTGLFRFGWVVPVLFATLLLASTGWSVAVALTTQRWLVSLLLVVVAVCSILLVAGTAEADNSTWYMVLGAVLFAVCTVLNDGVGWNANYLLKTMPSA
jgi:hypothetical protein